MSETVEQQQGDPAPVPARGRWATVIWLVCCTLVVVFVVGAWLRLQDERGGTNLGAKIADGERPAAPALPGTRLKDADVPGLPDWYRTEGSRQAPSPDGQVLVVNYWASWCGPCKDEAPVLRGIAEDYEGRVVVIGLNPGNEDTESDARSFVRDYELEFPIVRGDAGDKDAWGVRLFPESYVVGTDGRVSARILGGVEDDELRALIDDELAQDRT